MTDEPRLARASRPRSAVVVSLAGEMLVTIAVLIFLFFGWQLWFNNIVASSDQKLAADGLSSQWEERAAEDPSPAATTDSGEPVVMDTPAPTSAFANLIVPALGTDYKRPIAEGVEKSVLNNVRLGMGHYPQTQLPGQVGNFALASHRSAYGGAFHDIHQLAVGDSIYVETADGWYKYVFRGLEYVRVTGVGVILPVPQNPAASATERFITLTTCNPFYSSAERIIAYGIFDSWYPRADGPPDEIAGIATVTAAG